MYVETWRLTVGLLLHVLHKLGSWKDENQIWTGAGTGDETDVIGPWLVRCGVTSSMVVVVVRSWSV